MSRVPKWMRRLAPSIGLCLAVPLLMWPAGATAGGVALEPLAAPTAQVVSPIFRAPANAVAPVLVVPSPTPAPVVSVRPLTSSAISVIGRATVNLPPDIPVVLLPVNSRTTVSLQSSQLQFLKVPTETQPQRVTTSLTMNAGLGSFDVYVGPDKAHLTKLPGKPTIFNGKLVRRVSAAVGQLVFASVTGGPDCGDSCGREVEALTVPRHEAPPLTRDDRYYAQTGYRIDNDVVNTFFKGSGQVSTFGYPVSRTFTLLGCPVQMFQRLIIQVCENQPTAVMNLLDDIFPYATVNQSHFPGVDTDIKRNTPQVGTPEYDHILDYIQSNTPNTFQGEPVNFWNTWNVGNGLQLWGAPISQPLRETGNAGFIYQRFQRGIMHYQAVGSNGAGAPASPTTTPTNLVDWLKDVMEQSSALPSDLSDEAAASAYYGQWCPDGSMGSRCRPDDLPATDLTDAFASDPLVNE